MPLSMLSPGTSARILSISGRDALRSHLAKLGLVVGEVVTVIAANEGNLILQVKDSRVALGMESAMRIKVH